MGDSRLMLRQAIGLLKERFNPLKLRASSIYRSEPVDFLEQPWFYNQVVVMEARAELLPTQLLKGLQAIELQLGRVKTQRYGPRCIDLDLLLYENWVLETNILTVPHPKLEERAFVLYPLVELEPGLINPRTSRRISEVLAEKSSEFSACERVKEDE